ncbi:RNA polymerase sigma factor [Amycolatopsis aidingensis]|uniref:RNA polymerase sigma factor n=1 Tax=Amycolatopsis aidingensis TaxID=2842453 RepID=UPI001C0C0A16|nr:sigma-70 family RNA polymerase sigma factor [Amycolatopsis aidingensis]
MAAHGTGVVARAGKTVAEWIERGVNEVVMIVATAGAARRCDRVDHQSHRGSDEVERLLDAHGEPVYGLVRWMSRDVDVEDMFVAAWVEVCRGLDEGASTRPTASAILATAHRAVCDLLRTGSRPAEIDGDINVPPDAERAASRAGLTEFQRTVLFGAYFEGATCGELGAALGAGSDTVRDELRAALLALHERIPME